MTKSVSAPRCFQAIFAVLALEFDCVRGQPRRATGLRKPGPAVVRCRRDGCELDWWSAALSTPQPPEAVAAGQRLQSRAPPATMGPPSDGLGADRTVPVELVVGHHRPSDASQLGGDDSDVAHLAAQQPTVPSQQPILWRVFHAVDASQQGPGGEHQVAAHLARAHLTDAVQRAALSAGVLARHQPQIGGKGAAAANTPGASSATYNASALIGPI